MSKIVKTTFQKVAIPGGNDFVYPPEYDETKIEVIAYDFANSQCIGVIKDEDLASFIASDDIVEMTEPDAIISGDVWRPQTIKMKDPVAVINILLKVKDNPNSPGLTQDEINKIDPDNSADGLNKGLTFTDHLNRAKVKIDGG